MHSLTSFVVKAMTVAFCALLAVVLVPASGMAQEAKPLKGVALVVGEQTYETLPALPTPERDARGSGHALRRASLALAHLPARARRAAYGVAFGLLERGQHPADAAPEVGLRGEPLVQPGSNLGRGHAAPATGSRRALKGFSHRPFLVGCRG